MGGPQGQAGSLEQLAVARFGALSAAERKLVRAVPRNEIAYCGPSHDDSDPDNDPGKAGHWGPERQIRAELISWLCVDRRARDRVDPSGGIGVYAAKVVGNLTLSFVAVPFPLQLLRSALTDDANLDLAEIPFLNFSGSWVRSVSADGVNVKVVLLIKGFRADGTVFLSGAQIGSLVCSGGMFISPPRKVPLGSGMALVADNITVNGKLDLSSGFRAEGEVLLSDAQIRGTLDCSGSIFINPPVKEFSGGGLALNADRVTVNGNVFLSKGFRAEGEVRLANGQIGGSLQCTAGTFTNPPVKDLSGSGTALNADSITVNGNLLLSEGFRAQGQVRLANSQIGGSLDCTGGTFVNPLKESLDTSGQALIATSASLKRNALLAEGFCAEGIVDLTVARIGGDLVSRDGIFKAATFDLRDAVASSILDSDHSWPEPGKLYLDGFVYGRIADGPRDAATRLKWLGLQPEKPFARQPYLQLAKVLREGGDDDGARRLLIAMEDRRWETKEDRHWIGPLQRWTLRETVGYGYRPLWAFWEVLGLSALGWIIYRRSYLAGNMVPTDKDAYQSFKSNGQPPADHCPFAPLVYSVENSLPLVKLGQADKWQPDSTPAHPPSRQGSWAIRFRRQRAWPPFLNWLHRFLILIGLKMDPNPETLPSRFSRWGTTPRFVRWFLWIQILLGWLLATLFVAGVTGIVRME